jgi:Cu(I)/Ag(I) efflux system membrane fusion protein
MNSQNPTGTRIVNLRPEQLSAVGVQTVQVKKQPLVRNMHVAGMIGEDESRHGIITAPVEGRIDGLAMNCDGEQIHQRQPIANLFSRTLLDAADDYKRALKTGGADLEKARENLERLGLVSEQIATIPTRQPDDIHFGLIAQLSGTIVKSYVSEGQYVKAGEKLFETADLSRLWFVFNAYESDLPFIHKDQLVEVTTASLPGEKLKAKISFISPNLDETTHCAQVRVVLENREGRIKNKVFAEGLLETDAGEVLTVPRSAVLWPGSSPRVYVETTSNTYEQRAINLGRAGDTAWEVLDGLAEGERVVAAGNLLIDNQAQLENAISLTTINP